MANKRKATRKIKRLPLVFLNEGEKYRGRLSNLSATGMFIKTRRPLEPDSSIKICLHIDEEQGFFIDLEGYVVRKIKNRPTAVGSAYLASKNGMGVKLTHVSQEYNDLIAALHQ